MRNALLACLALLGASPGLLAQAATAAPSLADVLARPQLDAAAIDALYNASVLRDGNIDGAVKELLARAEDTASSKSVRVRALQAATHLNWRFGRLAAAAKTIEQALALETTADLVVLRARLLEASDRLADARKSYEQALTLLTSPEEQEDVRLRLTFLSTDTQNVEALVALARTRDRPFRNRAAVALAILNHPAEAADLYEVFGEGAAQQRQHLRLAQWALQAGQAVKAQDQAWQAVLGATLSRDIRYSLSVLVEAHELDASWERLLARFAGQPQLGPDAAAVRVDVLRRLGRFNEAIALIEGDRQQGITPESQRRLLRLYGEAGRYDAMVAEFRSLIAREPSEIAWPRSLSEHLLEQGRRDEAALVWKEFIDRNKEVNALLEAGRTMDRFGFDALALAAADKCLELHPDRGIDVSWYRFEHHLKRGNSAVAERLLREIAERLPPTDPGRIAVADAYERIKNPKEAVLIWEGLDTREGGLGVDESMRLAWLYDTTGQRDKAIGLWRKLWEGTLPDSRRRMVEDRLLQLAAETATLGDIAVELEQRLARGEARAKDSSLLIRIYTDASDTASAIEVIQEYYSRQEPSPAAAIASLREQARVYQALNRHGPFVQVTEKLLELDSDNRTDHLQSLILNQLDRGGRPDADTLQRRLGELRQVNAAAGDEFEAGVLVIAGLRDKAIDSYRRALARNPGSSDNYLLLADLLKQDRRLDEGVAMLQYFAEIAPGDDGFIVAIDGILNLKPGTESPALRWAHRRVIERLTRHDDKFYLYDLSAELAEEAKDTRRYLSSLENSLIDAGPRRATVLRELISATEDKSGPMMGNEAVAPDFRRNLSFSRRLIALGEEMPPDVYLNVGRAFLRMQNPDEALEAFNLAIDRTDRPSLVEESADGFESAGYGPEATVLYERALTGDADNVGVMSKLAAIRSRDGAIPLAHDLYLRALVKLAQQQPVEANATHDRRRPGQADDNFTYQYKRHYWGLQMGLLFTLPADASGALASLDSAFDQALQEVVKRTEKQTSRSLTNHPRLGMLSRLIRLTALHTGRIDLADRMDARLLRHFGSDPRLVPELVTQRLAWGLRDSAERIRTSEGVLPKLASEQAVRIRAQTDLTPLIDLRAAARKAVSERAFAFAAEAALAAGDPDQAYAVYQEWISPRRTAAPPPNADGARAISIGGSTMIMALPAGAVRAGPAAGGSQIPAAIQHAQGRLSPEKYSDLCRAIFTQIDTRPDLARELLTSRVNFDPFRGGPPKSSLFAFEEAAGRKLFTPEKLAATIAAIDTRQLGSIDLDYTMSTLPGSERVTLFTRYLQANPNTSYLGPALSALRSVLAQPLDEEAFRRVTGAVGERLQAAGKLPFGLRSFVSSLSLAGPPTLPVAADNLARIEAWDRQLAESFPESFKVGAFKRALVPASVDGSSAIADILDGALREFSQTEPGLPASATPYRVAQYLFPLNGQIYPRLKPGLLAALDTRAGESGLTPALFWTTLTLYQNDPSGDRRDALPWLERIIREQPTHRLALETALPLYVQTGRPDRERQVLEALVAAGGDTERHRQRLAELWRTLDHPQNALDVLGGRPRPVPSVLVASGFLNYTLSRFPQIGKLGRQLATATEDRAVRSALRGLFQMLPASNAPQFAMFQLAQGGTPVVDFASLLDLAASREALPPAPKGTASPSTFGSGVPWLVPLATTGATVETPVTTDRIVARATQVAATLPDFEALVRTLDPSAIDAEDQIAFYGLLADAYVANGRLAGELARLNAAVAARTAGRKDLILWMELLERDPVPPTPELAALAEKAYEGAGQPSEYQRIQLARVFARAGRTDDAIGLYSVAVVSSLATTGVRFTRSTRIPLTSATGLYLDAQRYLPPEAFARLVDRFAEITRPFGQPSLEAWHRQFLLALLDRTVATGAIPERLKALPLTLPETGVRREDRFRVTRLRSRLGSVEAALADLRGALYRGPDVMRSPTASMYGQEPTVDRYLRGLGLASTNVFYYGESPGLDRGNLLQLKDLFPASADAWPSARAWLVQSAAVLPGWIQEGAVDVDLGLQSLALLALRLRQTGLPEAATTFEAAQRLLDRGRVSTTTATLVLAVGLELGAPFDASRITPLVDQHLIDSRLLAGICRQLATSTGPEAAIKMGEAALVYTRSDPLLQELETLARRTGRPELAVRFNTLRTEAATARRTLDSGSPSPTRVTSL